jgi:putative PIN family toxin of toxin-antitoxin system
MRVVLDANVMVSGLISRQGPPDHILNKWLSGHFQLFVSPQILDELRRVLRYPRIYERLPKEQTAELLNKIGVASEVLAGTIKLDVLTIDPSDNIYLSCAVEAKTDYLVTGNRDHFEEAGAKIRGVRIISPRVFLDILKSEQQ